MKVAILLAISLIFVSCGRKTGPNSRSLKASTASSTNNDQANKKNLEAIDCSLLSNDANALRIQENKSRTKNFAYTLKVTPVIYKFSDESLRGVCESSGGSWKSVASPFTGYTGQVETEEQTALCQGLMEFISIEATYKSLSSVVKESEKTENYKSGLFLTVVNSTNTDKSIKSFFCKSHLYKAIK